MNSLGLQGKLQADCADAVFMGSAVISGQTRLKVFSTGSDTLLGPISEQIKPPLEIPELLPMVMTMTLTQAKIELCAHVDRYGENSQHVLELTYLNSPFETGIKSPLDQAEYC